MADFTLIIPTFNRPGYLERTLGYYRLKNCGFEIIVADSSSDGNKKKNKEVISVTGLKILHLDNYSEDMNPWHKFSDALSSVKTKYCLFCSDDDFVIPEGVEKSVDFLENHPDYSVAHGRYVVFVKNGAIRWMPGYSTVSIEFTEADARLSEHLGNYTLPTFCGVHRTDLMRMIFTETMKYTDDNRFGEILPSMIALIYGKMKSLPEIYAVQEINKNSVAVTTKTIPDYIKDGSYQGKYTKFRNCLAEHLVKNSSLDVDESRKSVDSAMLQYMSKNYPESKSFLEQKIKTALSFLPEGMYEKIRAVYIGMKSSSNGNLSDLRDSVELNEIQKYITSYEKNV